MRSNPAVAIAAGGRFARTSVGVTTSRGWLTLQGCVGDAVQRLRARIPRRPP